MQTWMDIQMVANWLTVETKGNGNFAKFIMPKINRVYKTKARGLCDGGIINQIGRS